MAGLELATITFTPELAERIVRMPGIDAYLPVIDDHIDEFAAGSVIDHVAVEAHFEDVLVGYAHAQRLSDSARWTLDIIVPCPEFDSTPVTSELLLAVRLAKADIELDWWVRGPHLGAASVLAQSLQLTRRQTVERMVAPVPVADPQPTSAARPFRREDAPAVVALHNAAFADDPHREPWTVDHVHHGIEALGGHGDDLLLLPDTGPPAAMCWVKRWSGRVAEIYVLAVDSDHQGGGWGAKALTAGLEHMARELGATEAFLYVDAGNRRAIRLYESKGFASARSPLVCFTVPASAS